VPSAGDMITMHALVSNASEAPLRRAAVKVVDAAGKPVATEELKGLLPGEKRRVTLTVPAAAGVNVLELVGATPLSGAVPRVVFAAVSPVGEGSCPLAVEPGSLRVRAVQGESGAVSVVSLTLHNVSATSVTGLRAALSGANGKSLLATAISIPGIESGASAPIEIRREDAKLPEREELAIDLDAYGSVAGSDAWPRIPVVIGRCALPDLVIAPDSIRADPASPSDGDTVWFDVPIENQGASRCDSFRLEAVDLSGAEPQEITARVGPRPGQLSLDAGASTTVRLRWDPFRNAGTRQIMFRAQPNGGAMDANDADNSAELRLAVRTKYNLRPAGIRPLPPTAEDARLRQFRVTARVENTGGTAAHGVRVVFYASKSQRTPENRMGEVLIDEIPAGGAREAVLLYKLKPGEEKRSFEFSFEALLKGSLQRVPYP
jgi:hypothetical protein